MRQRIGLAHALLGKPELIILDEPTSNLDPIGRAQVIDIINSLKTKDGFSFLVSSHILPELEKVCEHVVLMQKGKAVRQGPLQQLINQVEAQTFTIKAQPALTLVNLLENEKCVKTVSIDGENIIVVVENSAVFKHRLPILVSESNVSLEEVKATGKDLESLFKTAIVGE
jgi:ABC-2 type transport system ATP-binding protein